MGDGSKAKLGDGADAKPIRDQAYLDAVVEKRVKLFQAIQAEQAAQRASIAGEPIK